MASQSAVAAGAGAVPLAPPNKEPEHLTLPKPVYNDKLGFAIVGLGELALGEILPAFAKSEFCQPVALVSGHVEKAKVVAEHYGIDSKKIYSYENYDAIKEDPAINVVYVVLPNSMHAEYTIRALKAGKHVLCEKPMASNPRECREMIAAAKQGQRKLMIAYRLRYEPFNVSVIQMSRQHDYGPIRLISADNTQTTQAPNIRLSKELAGGPLGDVGVYCINACRYITGEEPTEVQGTFTQPPDDPNFREVPDRVTFTLKFPSGILGHCSGGFSGATSRNYRVICRDGWYGLDPAFDYQGLRLHTSKGNIRSEIGLTPVDHFAAEMDHFASCIAKDVDPVTPGEEGLRDTFVMAAIVRAATTGKNVRLNEVQDDWPIFFG